MSYLLLNVLFGGLPCWLGADVDWTWLTLAIIRYPIDRLKVTERDASNFWTKDEASALCLNIWSTFYIQYL